MISDERSEYSEKIYRRNDICDYYCPYLRFCASVIMTGLEAIKGKWTVKITEYNYQIQKRNIDVTQRVFDNMAKKFEYGYASSLDVTNTSTNLISAQQNYIQALTSMVQAHVNLKNLLNK